MSEEQEQEQARLRIDTSALQDRVAPPAGQLRSRFTVTAVLTAVCVGLFVLRYVWPGADNDHLMRMGANFGPRVKAGEVYRLFASAFLHADPIHILFNTIALWSFGPVLEALLGPRRYVVLYGASALAGALASAFFKDRMSVGASGAVWGLMVAGIALVYRPQGLLPPQALENARKRAWAPLVFNLMYSFRPGVDLLAHLGGGVVGGALVLSGVLTAGVAPVRPGMPREQRPENPIWTVLAAAMTLAMAGSVAAALAIGKPWLAGGPPDLVRTAVGDTGVTLELPRETAAHVTRESADSGAATFLYGETGDPFLFEVAVQPLEGAIPPEALESELEGLRDKVASSPDTALTDVSPAHVGTIGTYRAVLTEGKLKDNKEVPVKAFFLIVGAHLVSMHTFGVGKGPKSWEGIEEKVVASLQSK